MIITLKIEGVSMAKSPLQVLEEYVLSPDLQIENKGLRRKTSFPLRYKHAQLIPGTKKPVVEVTIINGSQGSES